MCWLGFCLLQLQTNLYNILGACGALQLYTASHPYFLATLSLHRKFEVSGAKTKTKYQHPWHPTVRHQCMETVNIIGTGRCGKPECSQHSRLENSSSTSSILLCPCLVLNLSIASANFTLLSYCNNKLHASQQNKTKTTQPQTVNCPLHHMTYKWLTTKFKTSHS